MYVDQGIAANFSIVTTFLINQVLVLAAVVRFVTVDITPFIVQLYPLHRYQIRGRDENVPMARHILRRKFYSRSQCYNDPNCKKASKVINLR